MNKRTCVCCNGLTVCCHYFKCKTNGCCCGFASDANGVFEATFVEIVGQRKAARAKFRWMYCEGGHHAGETFTLDATGVKARAAQAVVYGRDDSEYVKARIALDAEIDSYCSSCGGKKKYSSKAIFVSIVGKGKDAKAKFSYRYCCRAHGGHHTGDTYVLCLTDVKSRRKSNEHFGEDYSAEAEALEALEAEHNKYCDDCGGEKKKHSADLVFVEVVGKGKGAKVKLKTKHCTIGQHAGVPHLRGLAGVKLLLAARGCNYLEMTKALEALEAEINKCPSGHIPFEEQGLYAKACIDGRLYCAGDIFRSELNMHNGSTEFASDGMVIVAMTERHFLYHYESDVEGEDIRYMCFDKIPDYNFYKVSSRYCGKCHICSYGIGFNTPVKQVSIHYVTDERKLKPGDFIIASKGKDYDHWLVSKVKEVYSGGIVVQTGSMHAEELLCNHTLSEFEYIKAHSELVKLWQ